MQPFIVNLLELATGKTEFDWKAGHEFFEDFGNPDILDADVNVHAVVNNHGATVDVSCAIQGTLTVPCDRCLDELTLSVITEFSDSQVPEDDILDLRQDVYDYVCTALPMQRVHEEGQCNTETIKYLSK